MGKCQINKEIVEIGEDIYQSIHNLQNNRWANAWLNHQQSKEIKIDYFRLLFKSHRLCEKASTPTNENNVCREDFDELFDEFIQITKRLQSVEAQIKVKEFLNSLLK